MGLEIPSSSPPGVPQAGNRDSVYAMGDVMWRQSPAGTDPELRRLAISIANRGDNPDDLSQDCRNAASRYRLSVVRLVWLVMTVVDLVNQRQ